MWWGSTRKTPDILGTHTHQPHTLGGVQLVKPLIYLDTAVFIVLTWWGSTRKTPDILVLFIAPVMALVGFNS